MILYLNIRMMKTISGYIEIDGVISKITSVEDLHHVVESLGKDFTDMTKEQLCSYLNKKKENEGSIRIDDCGVKYCNDILKGGTKRLNQYKVADGVVAVDSNAFCYKDRPNHVAGECRYIYSVYILDVARVIFPSSLIAIGQKAFSYNNIEECVFSDSIQYIGSKAFSGCSNLCDGPLGLPKELRYLEAEAFAGCGKITSVVFHDKIKEIGSHAFRGCSALKTAYIPDSVERIGSGVFEDCQNLERICIPNGTKEKFEKLLPFDKDKLMEC